MNPILSAAQQQRPACLQFLRELVECESPSHDAASVSRFVDLFASRVTDIARIRTPKTRPPFGRALICDFDLPGPRRKQEGRILGLGHSDTVWPLGTLAAMPWRESEGKCWGPGVFDMKGGLAFFITALRIIRDLDIPTARRVSLLVVPDEEVGSEASQPLTEQLAGESASVLVLEPAAGPTGKLKTARKGVGGYVVTVRGKSSHAGLDFTAGANAIVELAQQIPYIAALTNLSKGITLSPGVIQGGSRRNVVPDLATLDVDLRVWKARDAIGVDRRMGALKAINPACQVHVEGGLNRAPLERSPAVVKLFRLAQRVAKDLELPSVEETAVGGGSDGNLTAGMGIPTLDGLGAVGDGAHAIHESILIDRVADRIALLAGLVVACSMRQ